MKYIITTLEEPISFNLSGSNSIVIDTKMPVQVTDEDFLILESRLGSQIQSVDMADSTPTPVEETEEVTPKVEEPKEEVIEEETVEETEEVEEEVEPAA